MSKVWKEDMYSIIWFIRRRLRLLLPLSVAVSLYLLPSSLTAPLTRRFSAAMSRLCAGFAPSHKRKTGGRAVEAALAKAELEITLLRRSMNALCAIRKERRITCQLLPARVVLRSDSSPVRLSILLNVGSEDGVRVGMPVLWGRPSDGAILVGVVKQLYRKGCRVALVGDIFVRVPVKVSPSGEEALLVSDGKNIHLKHIRSDRVRVGDAVLTSGYTGRFPAGVLVGYIATSSEPNPGGGLSVRTPLYLKDIDMVFVALFGVKGE